MLGRLTATIIVLVSLLFVFSAFVGEEGADHTVANGRVLESRFRSAASKAQGFAHRTGRLPTQGELDLLMTHEPPSSSAYSTQPVYIYPPDFKDCEGSESILAELRRSEYILAIWRGEWMECFAPSSGVSTVAVRPEFFTITGSFVGDKVASILLLLVTLIVARSIWCPQPMPVLHARN